MSDIIISIFTMIINIINIQLKHEYQVSRPGQPHISQAVGGEVVEVGQGGHVQEDHQGQVMVVIVFGQFIFLYLTLTRNMNQFELYQFLMKTEP